jgi:hypothetical protein
MGFRKLIILLIAALVTTLLSSCNQGSEEMVAFTYVNLIPMNSERTIENQTVLVKGSKIIAIGDSDTLQIPESAKFVKGNGAYLMPGLADMHMHTRADWEDPEVWPVHPLYLYLANGVTTIRDFAPYGSPLDYALQWREEIRKGTRIGPTIYASGKLLYASPLEDPEGIVRKNYKLGFDFLKLYSYLSKDDFHRAMAAAKALDLYTAGHIPYAVGLEGVLAEEMDEIAHVEELLFEFIDFDRDRQLSPEEWIVYIIESFMLQFDPASSTLQADFEMENLATLTGIAAQLRTAQVPVCTTMVVDDVIQLKLFHPDAFLERPENKFFESGYLESFQRGEEKHQVQCRGVEGICAFKYGVDRWVLKSLHDAGILLLLGTDSGTGGMGIVPGYSVHDELRILVENGFSPYEAIATGTINAAIVVERMTGDGNFGTIEVGKRADLILVRENPLEDVTTIKEPLGVMAMGRWYPTNLLDQLIQIPTLETSTQGIKVMELAQTIGYRSIGLLWVARAGSRHTNIE